jgi:hypothetical protein
MRAAETAEDTIATFGARVRELRSRVPMTGPLSPLPDTRTILRQARTDRRAAVEAIAQLSTSEQAALVCSAPLGLRARVLELLPVPEEVIPLLPEAEFCFTVRAIGLGDASWVLEHGTPSQLVTSLDLDCWSGLEPNTEHLREWLPALVEAGDETLLRTAQSIDTELLVLMLRERVHVMLDPKDEEWQAPPGAQTLDGQFYILANRPGDDASDIVRLLHALFQEDYWLYFRILQGVIWELQSGLDEWALRWRSGRLEDLGFPPWDEAMRLYGYLRESERDRLPEARGNPLDVTQWALPVYMPELPAAVEAAHSLFRAAAELDEDERQGFFYAFVGVANGVAIADRMPLGDAETLPRAIEIVAEVTSAAVEHLAAVHALSMPDVLRRVPLDRLFRVGAALGGRKPPPRDEPDEDAEEDGPQGPLQ